MKELIKLIDHLWTTVSPLCNYIAVDYDGRVYGYAVKPIPHETKFGLKHWGNDDDFMEFICCIYCNIEIWDKLIFERPPVSRRTELYNQIQKYFTETSKAQQELDFEVEMGVKNNL
jgi:hypothetical protein